MELWILWCFLSYAIWCHNNLRYATDPWMSFQYFSGKCGRIFLGYFSINFKPTQTLKSGHSQSQKTENVWENIVVFLVPTKISKWYTRQIFCCCHWPCGLNDLQTNNNPLIGLKWNYSIPNPKNPPSSLHHHANVHISARNLHVFITLLLTQPVVFIPDQNPWKVHEYIHVRTHYHKRMEVPGVACQLAHWNRAPFPSDGARDAALRHSELVEVEIPLRIV